MPRHSSNKKDKNDSMNDDSSTVKENEGNTKV